jgi:hypothetical protein
MNISGCPYRFLAHDIDPLHSEECEESEAEDSQRRR